MRTNIPEKLLAIIQQIDEEGDAQITRLTVLKKWFDSPARIKSFAIWLATRVCAQAGKTKPDVKKLFAAARKLIRGKDLMSPTFDRKEVSALIELLRGYQDEYVKQRWGNIRSVKNWNLYLVEQSLELWLWGEHSLEAAYLLAASYCKHYSSRHRRELNGPSRGKILEIVRFMNRIEAKEDLAE